MSLDNTKRHETQNWYFKLNKMFVQNRIFVDTYLKDTSMSPDGISLWLQGNKLIKKDVGQKWKDTLNAFKKLLNYLKQQV